MNTIANKTTKKITKAMTTMTHQTAHRILPKLLILSLSMQSVSVWAAGMDHSQMDMSHMDMSMPGMDMSAPAKAKPVLKKPASKKMPPSKAKTSRHVEAHVHKHEVHAAPEAKPAMDMSQMDHGSMDMSDMDMAHEQKPKSVVSKTEPSTHDMAHMDMSKDHDADDMQGMDMGGMAMPAADHRAMDHADHGQMNMSGMGGMSMGSMQGGSAPADARSPDYSQGRDFGPIAPPHMMGAGTMANLLINQLEVGRDFRQDHDKTITNYDVDAWVGTDWNRLALKAEGSTSNGDLEDARTELLWRRPVDVFWNSELGVRQDSGAGKDRTWLALGLQGISPYWVDLSGTVYVGDSGRAALRLEATYDWRITQRLILQPKLETNLYSKNDPARDIGQGVSDLQAGLRLRYEITRQFAPYIGVQTEQRYGKTAEYARAKGESASQTMAVAGVRLWF